MGNCMVKMYKQASRLGCRWCRLGRGGAGQGWGAGWDGHICLSALLLGLVCCWFVVRFACFPASLTRLRILFLVSCFSGV